MPVWVALPVVCKTNHGMAIAESILPTSEMAFAMKSETMGSLFFCAIAALFCYI
jgi:hypothetical protein